MSKQQVALIPPHGYITEIANEAGCTIQYVTKALRKGARGEKADLVRKIYNEKYGSSRRRSKVC